MCRPMHRFAECSPSDVAEIAHVDPATIRRAVSGDLFALRIAPGGRLLRFRPGDVAAWAGEP